MKIHNENTICTGGNLIVLRLNEEETLGTSSAHGEDRPCNIYNFFFHNRLCVILWSLANIQGQILHLVHTENILHHVFVIRKASNVA